MKFTKVFEDAVRNESRFQEYMDIVKKNSKGNIWLIGGFIYRNIISEGGEIKHGAKVDLDFLVEKPSERIELPQGWTLGMTSYGNPVFVEEDTILDLSYLVNYHSIVARGLEPKIENFFTGTPLNIQSIAYDFNRRKVIGEIGINAIKSKTIRVNNLKEAEYEAVKKGVSVEELVKEKAKDLGFKAIL